MDLEIQEIGMGLQFDSISALPTGEAAQVAQQRRADRQQRQARGTAQRRGHLLDVAFALFEELGVEGFNMRHMAQRAGYTPGALYAYFQGKDAILAALRLRVAEQLADEVRAVRLQKPSRSLKEMPSRAVSPSFGTSGGDSVPGRTLFVAQNLAWWSRLAREPHRLPLLLKPGEPTGAHSGDGPGSEPALLALLEEATAPALATLHTLGLPPETAQQVHDEVLAYGIGLLALQPGTGLETRFVQALHRWLDRECGLAACPALDGEGGGSERQGDLFAG
jgi:AcrR family transcriptional regulator